MVESQKVTGSHLVGMALKLEGVNNLFVLAGDHILHLLDVLSDMNLRFIDTRHEQAAVHTADAWGRITGSPGVCMYTTPGFANAIPGLANAQHSESPVISISGCAELKNLGRGAMQEIDQVRMAASVTKGSWMVTDAGQIPFYIARMMKVAFGGRRGPVHLTIPTNLQEQEVSIEEMSFWNRELINASGTIKPDPDLVEQAVQLLNGAERPFVVAGGPAAYASSGDSLTEFIETTHVPLFTEDIARGLVPDNHPYCFGFFERGLNPAARLISEADVVMLLGRKQDYTIGYARPPVISSQARIIQVDPSPEEVGRNRSVDVGIEADVGATVQELIKSARKYKWTTKPWITRLREAAKQALTIDNEELGHTSLHPIAVHQTLAKFLRVGDFLSFDGGNYAAFARIIHQANAPKRWFYLPTSGMLGSSIPTAIAAKIAYPDARVVAVTGDGAFGFNAMEIDTAVRHNLPIVVVIGNDAAWGVDKDYQMGTYGRAVVTDLLPSRYDLVAQGLGAHGEYVEKANDLEPALERAFASGKPAIINVRTRSVISPRAQYRLAMAKNENRDKQ